MMTNVLGEIWTMIYVQGWISQTHRHFRLEVAIPNPSKLVWIPRDLPI